MLHKIRKAMRDRDDRYRLSGLVAVDQGYVGGEEHGEGGRGRRGVRRKSVVGVAVQRRDPGRPGEKPIPGFAALEVMADPATETLEKLLIDKLNPGSHVRSDGWHGYRRPQQRGFAPPATVISKQDQAAHVLFPWVHITLSNVQRLLLGAHHNVKRKPLQRYVAEFNYRLNRRTMESDPMVRPLRACIRHTNGDS